ncbi:MAG: CaiB/BaiF CoA-transferase family protein [Rhizobiaceae bacterium]|nr:CaiB/BaiF CoA-transferase family protein [Rhizobiaceae bacterium]
MTLPLEGLLVIAIEQAVAAPLCTARLADAGARVIKIERAEGDFARGYDTAAKGDSSYFAWLNQGKESVVLNYREPEGKALLEALMANADVLVQNMAPGALERAGFGSAGLRDKHPRLITCDITGYGESEELAAMKAYDLLVQAESGLVSVSGGPNELGRIGVSVCDIGAGMTAHAAILEALIQRGITGKGSGIGTSLFEVAAEWMAVPLIHAEYGSGAPKRVGLNHPSIAPYGAYKTSDGDETLISIQNEREWHILCEDVLGQKELATDPRFASNNQRVENRPALDEALLAIMRAMTSTTFREKLARHGIAFGAVNSVDDLSKHNALRGREIETSSGETLTLPAPPVRWALQPRTSAGPIPKIGEHTETIRNEFLG